VLIEGAPGLNPPLPNPRQFDKPTDDEEQKDNDKKQNHRPLGFPSFALSDDIQKERNETNNPEANQ
jgi:hypothetical protein